jgi:heat shock protein HtpX
MARPGTFGRDPKLAARMGFTIFMLGLVYVVFFVVLWQWLQLSLPFVLLLAGGLLFFQYWSSDKIALRSAGARVVDNSEAPELHAIIQRLCMTAGLPMPRVAIIPTDTPNAFATGRSPRHAAVAVTQGLMERLTPRELEGVIAHELAHVKHRDVAVMTLASFFAMVAGIVVQWGPFLGGGFGGDRDRNGGAAGFVVVLVVAILVYVLSFILINALSRYREFAADRGASILTKSPSSLASALLKISGSMGRIPQRDLRMAEGLNQFFIIPMHLKGGASGLFSTHPPLEARLEQLRRLERELEGI